MTRVREALGKGKSRHSLEHLPELEHVPAERRQSLYKAALREVPLWLRAAFWVAFFLLFFVASFAADVLFGSRLNPVFPRWAVTAIVMGAAGGLSWILCVAFDRAVVRPMIWRRIPSLCDSCGYDLTGNTSGVCPECGREIAAVR